MRELTALSSVLSIKNAKGIFFSKLETYQTMRFIKIVGQIIFNLKKFFDTIFAIMIKYSMIMNLDAADSLLRGAAFEMLSGASLFSFGFFVLNTLFPNGP
jgi:hypothetical protein